MYPVDPVTRIVCALADMPMPKGSAAAQCEAALLSCPAEPAPVHAGGTRQRKQRPEGMQRGHLAGALATVAATGVARLLNDIRCIRVTAAIAVSLGASHQGAPGRGQRALSA